MILQLRESLGLEKSLKEKIVKEKQIYSNLLDQYKQLQNIQPVDHPPELLSDTSQKEEDESLKEEVKSSQSQVLDEETQTELTKLQSVMKNVSSTLEKVEVIMKYWSEKVILLCTTENLYVFSRSWINRLWINRHIQLLLVNTEQNLISKKSFYTFFTFKQKVPVNNNTLCTLQ